MSKQDIMLSSLSLEELENVIIGAVSRGISAGVSAVVKNTNSVVSSVKETEFLTAAETAKLFRVSTQTVADMTKRGLLIGERFGVRILYRRAAIEQALVSTDRYQRTGNKPGPKPKSAQ